MRLLKVSLSLVFLISACDPVTKKEWFPPVQERVNHLTYVKDSRTGLCFIHNEVNNGHGFAQDVYTNVPCSPEVEKILVK